MNDATSPQQRIIPAGFAGAPIVGQDSSAAHSPIVNPQGRPVSSGPPPNPLAREHPLAFGRAEIDAAVDARLHKLRPTANVRGFRKGHVPMNVLRRHFAQQHLNQELTRRAEERFNAEKKNSGERMVGGVGSLRLAADPPAENGDYRVRCQYEVFPDIPPPDFSAVKIPRPAVHIGDDEADRMIERLRLERGQFVAVDRPAAENDRVVVDYQATERGARVDGATNRAWMLGGAQMDAVSAALIGARAGEVRSLELKHGPDHPDPDMRGKRIRLRISVKSVSELQIPALTPEFFALFEVREGGLEAFRKAIREMTRRESEHRRLMVIRERALYALALATPAFPLPRILVQTEAAALRQQDLQVARQQGLPAAAVDANLARYALVAAQKVRSGLVVDAWRARENIKVPPGEIEARLEEISTGYDDPDEFKAQARQNPEIMGNVELQLVEDRAAAWAEERAAREDQPMTMEQLWGWEEISPEGAESESAPAVVAASAVSAVSADRIPAAPAEAGNG